jgi:putative peptide zinc metalloprotease protein
MLRRLSELAESASSLTTHKTSLVNPMESKYKNNFRIVFHEFTRQYDDQEVTIQSLVSGIPLVLPLDALEILDDLASGKTIEESSAIYQKKYNVSPDLLDLLDILEQEGFIQPEIGSVLHSNNQLGRLKQKSKPSHIRYHFENFSQVLAQQIFGRKILYGCFALISLSVLAIALDPSIIPGWKAHFFTQNLTLTRFGLTVFDYVTLFLHEMAHLVAAKAVGVSSRMGISNRLWYLVAETDMTGVWGIPREQRYLPFLAGPLLDTVSSAILILVLFTEHHQWIILPVMIIQAFRAMLLIYLMRLFWQCYLFVRTDFYFVFANIFRCKNLMKDTETFLQNRLTRIIRSIKKIDQSNIPLAERRVIGRYAVLWVVGRIAALASLAFIEIPLLWNYFLEVTTIIGHGFQVNPYAFIDAVLMILLILGPQLFGFYLWFRSFRTSYR